MITLYLLIWVALIWIDVWNNYEIIEVNDSRPNYLLMNIVRGMFFIVYGAFVWNAQADIRTFYIFLYCTTSFWVLFDLSLNVIRGKHPLYIGQNSGWIDQFGFKYPALYYIGKIVALAALVFSIAKIYQ